MMAGSVPITRAQLSMNFAAELLPRSHKAVSAEANYAALDLHWHEHLPKHFEKGAGARYGYARRTSVIGLAFLQRTNPGAYARVRKLTFRGRERNLGKYADVKSALGLSPLVWTGQTRSMARSAAFRKITKRGKNPRLTVRTPNYFASRFRGNKFGQRQAQALSRATELEVMTPAEQVAVIKAWEKEYRDIQTRKSHPKHSLVAFRQRRKRGS